MSHKCPHCGKPFRKSRFMLQHAASVHRNRPRRGASAQRSSKLEVYQPPMHLMEPMQPFRGLDTGLGLMAAAAGMALSMIDTDARRVPRLPE